MSIDHRSYNTGDTTPGHAPKVTPPEQPVVPSPTNRQGVDGRRPLPAAAPSGHRRQAAPDEPSAGFVGIGRILGAWGVKGSFKVQPLTDFPDRFDAGATLWVVGVPRTVESNHWQRGNVVIKATGIDDPESAAALRGALVEIPEADLHPLGEDEYYIHDLIGLSVFTPQGAVIGRVTDLLPTGANDVLVIQGDMGNYLIPMIADAVQSVNLHEGRIIAELIDGLEPTPHREKRERQRRPSRGRAVAGPHGPLANQGTPE